MSYRIVFKNALNARDKSKPGVVIKADGYLVKDGELETMIAPAEGKHDGRTRTVYKSGVKITGNVKAASIFDTASEATKYQQLVGVRGKRGQIVKVPE